MDEMKRGSSVFAILVIICVAILSTDCNAPDKQTLKNAAENKQQANQQQTNRQQTAAPIDWKRVDDAMGRKGTMMPGDVYRFSMPRSDLKVMVKGIEQSALHHHLLYENPRVMYMHFWANDDAVKLARGLRAALDKTNSQRSQTQ